MLRTASLLVLQTVSVAACDCDYHKGGCTISIAPAPGTLCKCRYALAWTCHGSADIKCSPSSQSWCCNVGADLGTRTSKQCCEEGGGDCGGYKMEEDNATEPSAAAQEGFAVASEVSSVLSDAISDSDGINPAAPFPPAVEAPGEVQEASHTGQNDGEQAVDSGEQVKDDGEGEDLLDDLEEEEEDEDGAPGFLQATDKGCACNYQRRRAHGCKIVTAPKPTQLCQCYYKGAWTCQGYAVGCDPNDASACCRADATEETRKSYACCQHAKPDSGDCDGY